MFSLNPQHLRKNPPVKDRVFKKELTPHPFCDSFDPCFFSQKNLSVDFEIGSGNGEFCINRALEFPHKTIIAIEKTRNKINKAFRKKLPKNLKIFHTNAVWWAARFAKPFCFDSIFIFYPNPYPKNKHSNLRWIRRPFMGYLLNCLKLEGTIEIRTNEFFYYQEIGEIMPKKFPFMKCVSDRVISSKNPQTPFERKYVNRMKCRSLQFKRMPE